MIDKSLNQSSLIKISQKEISKDRKTKQTKIQTNEAKIEGKITEDKINRDKREMIVIREKIETPKSIDLPTIEEISRNKNMNKRNLKDKLTVMVDKIRDLKKGM